MKHRLVAVLAVFATTLTITGSALAFDCMRVSSSMQGLQQSASNSGMWLFVDMSPGGGGIAEILHHFNVPPTPQLVICLQNAYTTAQASNPALPTYFALGFGVAGGKNDPVNKGVLAHNNPNTRVLSNGTGIDHFDDTVLPVLMNSGCLPPPPTG
jgi:hypothetical protein